MKASRTFRFSTETERGIDFLKRLSHAKTNDTAVIEQAIADKVTRLAGGDILKLRIQEAEAELRELRSLLPV